jgi:hypothetical protein
MPFLAIQNGEGGEYKGISVAFMISYDSTIWLATKLIAGYSTNQKIPRTLVENRRV